MKGKLIFLIVGLVVLSLALMAFSVNKAAAGHDGMWCRYEGLSTRPGYFYERFISFTVQGFANPTQATLRINGFGDFSVQGLSCTRFGFKQTCSGYLTNLPSTGQTDELYSGTLRLKSLGVKNSDDTDITCTAINIPLP